MIENILIDAREFNPGRLTGIGRVLSGLIDALAKCDFTNKIILAAGNVEAVPYELKQSNKVETRKIPQRFASSELAITKLTKNGPRLLLSPYPKIPLTGSFCPTINMVHDVFFITHPAYKNKLKGYIERIRLKVALKKANLTWFVSNHSLQQTKKVIGITERSARVRYSAIDRKFNNIHSDKDTYVLRKYNLHPGYILVIGNGKPHKNLGILLQLKESISRKLVFVGVSETTKNFWAKLYPNCGAIWIDYVKEKDLPAFIRNSFCLAQPSNDEGYGLPPLEAIACGTPAVVSNIPVLTETTCGKALTADPDNPGTWLKAFEALENQEFYQFKINTGLEWVERLKSPKGWEAHLTDIKTLLQSTHF
jgi:glycosyltransferase involved in cell wall biosynthesis